MLTEMITLRLLARFEGIPKYTGLELSLMTRYFVFLVVVSLFAPSTPRQLKCETGLELFHNCHPLFGNPFFHRSILAESGIHTDYPCTKFTASFDIFLDVSSRLHFLLIEFNAFPNSFILLQGLTGTSSGFLQIVTFVIYYVKLFILGSTPRAVWGIKFNPGNVAWGTLFPNMTLLVVISAFWF